MASFIFTHSLYAASANGTPGCVGLETAFSVCYTKLCKQHGMPLSRLSRMLSRTPAQIMGLN